MARLTLRGLTEVLRWASEEKDKKGRSLLERARESLRVNSYKNYRVSTDWGGLGFSCTCQAFQRGGGKPCKHVIAKLLLEHKDILVRASKEWAEWFKQYHALEKERLEAVLRDFDAFSYTGNAL